MDSSIVRNGNNLSSQPFLADVQVLRKRVKQHLHEGRTGNSYLVDSDTVVKLLDDLLANEIICVLRYRRHRFMTSGEPVRDIAEQFVAHASEEQDHADQLAERIFLLGSEPNFSPGGLTSRDQAAYLADKTLLDLVKEDMIAECIAMDNYRDIIHYLRERTPERNLITRRMLEGILADEVKHGHELANLLESLPVQAQ